MYISGTDGGGKTLNLRAIRQESWDLRTNTPLGFITNRVIMVFSRAEDKQSKMVWGRKKKKNLMCMTRSVLTAAHQNSQLLFRLLLRVIDRTHGRLVKIVHQICTCSWHRVMASSVSVQQKAGTLLKKNQHIVPCLCRLKQGKFILAALFGDSVSWHQECNLISQPAW